MLQEIVEQIKATVRETVSNEVHTAMPGQIVSFNAAKCTATVLPKGQFVAGNGKKMNYPQITGVPVVMPYSTTANVGVAFPVSKGDPCMIVISEVELDSWKSGAQSKAHLQFDLSSAMCVPGLLKQSSKAVKEATAEKSVVISNDSTILKVKKDEVYIEGNLTVKGIVSADNI